MPIDHATLIMAIACTGTSLAIASLAVWLATPVDRFLLSWMGGVGLIVVHALLYSRYVVTADPILLISALAVLPPGLALLRAAATQFRDGRLPTIPMIVAGTVGIVLCTTPMVWSLDGLALIFDNLWAALMLGWTAAAYAEQRSASPIQIGAIAALYAICALSFVACGIALAVDGRLSLGVAPVNEVENVSAVVWIISMTGIGGLSLSLAQARRAHGNRRDAVTDQLTGLLNRRGMIERHGARPMAIGEAVLIFDLDRFKNINDRFGHAIGDRFLIGFAETLNAELGVRPTVARIGGEEFAVILSSEAGHAAAEIADRIRRRFADVVVDADGTPVGATVSAGVAYATTTALAFDERLDAADRSLYAAKRGGRNRVVALSSAA